MGVKAIQGAKVKDLVLEHSEHAFGPPAPTLGQLKGALCSPFLEREVE